MLDFLAKRAGFPIKKLLLSAVANATQMGIEKENLFIKELRVDKGIVMKRMMPAAMGTGHRINKRTSHVTLVLAEKVVKKEKTKAKEVKVKKAPAKKAGAKK
jgi:large subunit ribosomal protein L22